MNRKKLTTLAVTVFAAASFLGACSSEKESAEQTRIQVWAMGEEGNLLPELAEKFEEDNPNINVDVQAIPWGQAHEKLLTAVASGNGPDVLQLGTTWVPEFADADILLDLSPYLEKNPELAPDNYFPGAVESMMYGEKVVGIPWYVDTRVLYYRTDLLAEVGYDQAPATWDELKDAAAKLAARGDGMYGYDIDLNDQLVPVILSWQNGSEYIDENGKPDFGEEFQGALEFYASFFEEGLTPTSGQIEIVDAFKNGVKPMFQSGPWMVNMINNQAPELEGQWGTAVLPGNVTNTSAIGGSNLSVFHNSEHVEEAVQFISYLNEVDTQLNWYVISNALPSRTAAWEDAVFQEDPMLSAFGEQLEATKATPQIVEFEKIAQELLRMLEKVVVGGAEMDGEVAKFKETVDGILEE